MLYSNLISMLQFKLASDRNDIFYPVENKMNKI